MIERGFESYGDTFEKSAGEECCEKSLQRLGVAARCMPRRTRDHLAIKRREERPSRRDSSVFLPCTGEIRYFLYHTLYLAIFFFVNTK